LPIYVPVSQDGTGTDVPRCQSGPVTVPEPVHGTAVLVPADEAVLGPLRPGCTRLVVRGLGSPEVDHVPPDDGLDLLPDSHVLSLAVGYRDPQLSVLALVTICDKPSKMAL